MFHLVSTLRKQKAIVNIFFSMQMSQISLEKKQFSPDECLPNFNLKFDFFERPKNPPDFALLGSREKKGIDKNRFFAVK